MTTLTTAAPAQPETRRRPVPWRKLAWVTWRQHRFVLAGAATLLGGACLVMLINGLAVRSSLRSLGLTACHPVTAPRCAVQLQLFHQEYNVWVGRLPAVFLVIPILIGVFAGGPLLAREFETGTFRFAWTQGAGRLRWVTAKLVLLAVSLTVSAALFSLMFSWWYEPFFAQHSSLMTQDVFPLSGLALAAWTLAAFAISVRRRGDTAHRPGHDRRAGRLDRALRRHGAVPAGALPGRGHQQGNDPDPGTVMVPGRLVHRPGRQARQLQGLLLQWLSQRGYTLWTSYQPETRFWHFQLIESGWLLALALLLGAATVWLVRRRVA